MKVKGCLLCTISALIGLATVIIFVVALIKGINESQKGALYVDRVGTSTVHLEAGNYTIFNEGEGSSLPLSSIRIESTTDGKTIPLESSAGSHYTVNGREGRSFGAFPAVQSGDYRIEIARIPGGSRITLVRDFTGSIFRIVLQSLAIIFAGLFLALVLLIAGIVLLVKGSRVAPGQ
jgi:hypothetical protein